MTVVLPIIWIVVSCGGIAVARTHKWGRIPLYLLPLVNLIAIWFQIGRNNPDYFFLCVCMVAVSGIAWAFLMVSRDDDLLFKGYYRQITLVMGIFTTVWWVGALLSGA